DVMACVGNSAALSMDLLCISTASGDFSEAERVNLFLLSEGESAVRILRSLQKYFNRLYMTRLRMDQGSSMDSAMGQLKPPIFWKNKAPFQSQVSGWTTLSLEQALTLLTTAEAKCKQTGSSPETL